MPPKADTDGSFTKRCIVNVYSELRTCEKGGVLLLLSSLTLVNYICTLALNERKVPDIKEGIYTIHRISGYFSLV